MFLTDEPIQNIEDDELSRNIFVEELTQSLLSRNPAESLVVGLDSPWGSGKSSVLNLLENRIEKNSTSKINLIRFDPWYFNSTEKLLQSFFEEINRVLDKQVGGNGLKQAFSKYRKVLTSVQVSPKVSFMGIELSMGNLDIELGNPEELRKKIRKQILGTKLRVIVLVDNLDRLDISELLLIFKLVRLCSDFPGFTFILAIDKQQTLKLLKSNNLSVEFIEKIIQVDIKLPAIEQTRIDDFISKGLNWIAQSRKIHFNDFFWSRFSQIYQATVVQTLIGTLRDAKRFLNTADFSIPVVQGEVDYADFLVLQLIRTFFPDVYDCIPQFKGELTKLQVVSFGYGDEWQRKERIAVFKELNTKVQSLAGDSFKIANDLLGFLFPNYYSYLKNPENPSMQGYTTDYEKHQMISARTHFDRYFTMRVASDDIPTSSILEFVDRLNAQGDSLDIQDQFISIHQAANNLGPALKKLDLYVDQLNENAKLHLVHSLINSSSAFGSKGTNHHESELSRVKKLVSSCVLTFEEVRQIELIDEAISSSPSILFSLLVAQDSVLARWFPFTDEVRKHFLETIRVRIHNDLIDKKVDVFASYPAGFGSILGPWRNKEFLNEEELAKAYTKELLEEKPVYAIKILSIYIWFVAGTEKPSDFAYDEFEARYDPKEIKSALDRLDIEKLTLSENESFAVNEFTKLYHHKISNATNE